MIKKKKINSRIHKNKKEIIIKKAIIIIQMLIMI